MEGNAPPNQPDVDIAEKILSNEMRIKVDFTIPKGFGERKKAKRWAVNPEANWGPKKAASGKNKRKMEVVMRIASWKMVLWSPKQS